MAAIARSRLIISVALAGCQALLVPVSAPVTMTPGPKSKPWCYFDNAQGCPFDELGHTPPEGTYKRLTPCPAGSAQVVCPPLGPTYATATAVADRATVYVYRSNYAFAAVGPYVYANGERLSDLAPGGYLVYYAPAGELELSTRSEPNTPVRLQVQGGETYYVAGYFHHDANRAPAERDWFQLEVTSANRLGPGLERCRLIPADRDR